LGFQGGDGALASGFRGQTKELAGGIDHRPVKVDNLDALQIMALADFEVIRVVGRRDLDGAGTKFRIDKGIADNDNFTIG